MQAHIFAFSRRNYEPDISKLASILPTNIISSTELFVIDEVDDEVSLPRYIAKTENLTEEQINEIQTAFYSLAKTDLELKIGEAVIEPVNLGVDIESLPASFFGTTETELLKADAARKSIEDTLKIIMQAEPSGVDYPEKNWEGDMLEAYKIFVDRLRKEPMMDKGASLTENMVSQAAEKRPQEIALDVWEKVLLKKI